MAVTGSTVLTIAQTAASDPALNLARPASLFPSDSNGDTSPAGLLRALSKTIAFLASTYDWQALRSETTFTAAGSEVQFGAIPIDFLRFVPETFFDSTFRRPVNGPLTPQDWQTVKRMVISAVYPAFTQRNNAIHILPVPPSGNVFSFEYISTSVAYAATPVVFVGGVTSGSTTVTVTNTAGLSVGNVLDAASIPSATTITAIVTNTSITLSQAATASVATETISAAQPKSAITADTDVLPWDDELITLGVIYQYRKGERLDYAQDETDFNRMLLARIKQDGGRRMLDMNGGNSRSSDARLKALKSNAIVVADGATWSGSNW